MYKKFLISIILILICLAALVVTGQSKLQGRKNLNNFLGVSDANQKTIHPLIFFEVTTFYKGVGEASKKQDLPSYHISAGIIPHHLFPGFLIADFFNRLTKQNPKVIILIGPNHPEAGNFQALTSLYGWDTPFGTVFPKKEIIQLLLKNNLVKIDEEILTKEHSVAGMMPFIKFYLPDSQVVPVILSGRMTIDQVRILANNLKNYIDKDTVIIAPVDFSHYLTDGEAQEKDDITLKVLQNFDYKQLFSFNNDYLDSPPSVATILMVAQMLNTTNLDLLFHTNSGELQKNNFIATTSYFSIAFH